MNVLLSADMARVVCLCKYHENIKMLCESLHRETDDFPMYSGSFAENFVCNPESELCILGKINVKSVQNVPACCKIKHLTEEEAVVQVDFAKITAASNREKFSQHIGAKTKLPCSLLQSGQSVDKNSCCESHVIVSDDLNHDKSSAAVFMCTIVNDLGKGRHQNIT